MSENIPELSNNGSEVTVTANVTINSGHYKAEIVCPKSANGSREYVGKIYKNSHNNWNPSNFYKHCRTHAKPDGLISVKNFFSPMKDHGNAKGSGHQQETHEDNNAVNTFQKNNVIVSSDDSDPDPDNPDPRNSHDESEGNQIETEESDFHEDAQIKSKS